MKLLFVFSLLFAVSYANNLNAQILEASYPYHLNSSPQQWMDFEADNFGNIFGCAHNVISFPNGLPSTGSGTTVWYKLDSNGDAVWSHRGGSSTGQTSKILEIKIGDDNSIWVSGFSTYGLFPDSINPGFIYNYTYFIAKMNQDGTFENINRFPNQPQFDVTETGEVAFAVARSDAGYIDDEYFPNYDVSLIYGLMDPSGNVLWRNILPAATTAFSLASEAITKDGKFIFSGLYNGTMNFDGTPITLDNSGFSPNKDYYIVSVDLNTQQIDYAAETVHLKINDLAIDDSGFVYTTVGHYNSNNVDDAYYGPQLFPNVNKSDAYILKLNPDLTYNTSHNVAGQYTSAHPNLSILELVEHNGNIFAVGTHDWMGTTTIFTPGGTNYTGQENRFILKLDNNLDYQHLQVFPGGGGLLMVDENNDNVFINFNGTNPYDTTGFNHTNFFAKIKTNANIIKGRAYKDFNQNQVYDAGDVPIDGSIVSTVPPVLLSVTNPDGTFEFYLDSGQYTIELPSVPMYYSKDPLNANFSLLGYNLIDSADLRIVPVPGAHDLELDYFSTGPMRVGDTVKYKIIVTNQGTYIENGTVKLYPFNYSVPFDTIYTSPQMYNGGGFLGYDFTNLGLGDTFSIQVSYPVDTTFLPIISEISNSLAVAEIPNNDTIPTNNFASMDRPIVAAYDPNIKLVSNNDSIYFDSLSTFDNMGYLVHFQNEGNFPATNVKVEDEILQHLDILSLQIIDYSHPIHATVHNNTISFHFDSIMLAPKLVDEPASKGYVYFKIKKEQNLNIGDSIRNNADIFFDYNPAIVTNYAVNYIIDQILVSSITVQGQGGVNFVLTGNTLQMEESILPLNAHNTGVTWSVTNGSGTATIDQSGVLTGGNLGMVTVIATANDGSGIFGTAQIEVTDDVGVSSHSNSFEIYPNPTNGSVLVKYSKLNVNSIAIYSSNGSEVAFFDAVSDDSFAMYLDIQDGIYIIELNTTEGVIRQKLIKQ